MAFYLSTCSAFRCAALPLGLILMVLLGSLLYCMDTALQGGSKLLCVSHVDHCLLWVHSVTAEL